MDKVLERVHERGDVARDCLHWHLVPWEQYAQEYNKDLRVNSAATCPFNSEQFATGVPSGRDQIFNEDRKLTTKKLSPELVTETSSKKRICRGLKFTEVKLKNRIVSLSYLNDTVPLLLKAKKCPAVVAKM